MIVDVTEGDGNGKNVLEREKRNACTNYYMLQQSLLISFSFIEKKPRPCYHKQEIFLLPLPVHLLYHKKHLPNQIVVCVHRILDIVPSECSPFMFPSSILIPDIFACKICFQKTESHMWLGVERTWDEEQGKGIPSCFF